MLLTVVETLGGWIWWVAGLALLCVEIVWPGRFFLWIGIVAIAIGTGALAFHSPWPAQAAGFVTLSVVAALVASRLRRRRS